MKISASKITILITAAFLFSILTINQAQAAPGDLDPSFGNGGKVFISGNTLPIRVRVQPDGKIMTFGDYAYTSYAFLARNNSNGTPDSSFSGGLVFLRQFDDETNFFSDFVTLPDGKYLMTGSTDFAPALFRYNSNGTPDTSFGTNGVLMDSFSGEAIALQPDGKVIIGGYNAIDGVFRYFLVRYNTDGTLDAGFGENGIVFPSQFYGKIVLQPDGKILVRASDVQIARYNSNGSRDNTFRFTGIVGTGISNVAGIGFQSDGKIIVGGTVSQTLSRIERYNDNGTLDTTFGTNGRVDITDTSNNQYSLGIIRSLAVQRNNKIVTAGSVNGIFAVYRFDSNGGRDATFGTNGLVTTQMSPICRFFDITLQPDGKIVAVGDAGTTIQQVGLVRYLGDPTPAQLNLTVTRSDDRNNAACVPGDCSLREAVNAANASATDDTIAFAPGLTRITLTNEIVINNAGALTINGTGANNLTIDGGAGTNRIFYINATVTISGATLTGGNGAGADSIRGGGAILANGGSLTLDSVHVTGNTTPGDGGGVLLRGSQNYIFNSTFSGNTGLVGGGFGNYGGNLTVVNSTISGNTGVVGGGISNGSDMTLRNVTISNNTASNMGGGIFQEDFNSRLTFGNTIVAGNNCGSGSEIFFSGLFPENSVITSAGGNLVGDSSGDSTNTGPFSIAYQPTDIRDTNPLQGALQKNGGTTPTLTLLAGSPAIDTGLNTLVSPIAPAFDQRGTGFARIRDGNGDGTATVDIGAFEVQPGATAARRTPFDFDGDGKADVSVFRPSNGTWYLQQSTNGFTGFQFGIPTDKIVPADYDGDGRTDIAVYRDGTWYLQRSRDGFIGIAFGTATDIPMPADYTGDGKAEIAVFRQSDGGWYVYNLADNQFTSTVFGQAGDVPVAADYDGDGKADIAVVRNRTWHILRSRDGITAVDTRNFAQPGDKPVPADYDGDGKADIAVFRNGGWALSRSQLGYTTIGLGSDTDLPVPADYDGDGKADVAIFRPSDGFWYFRSSSQSGFTGFPFGNPTDKPVPNAFVGQGGVHPIDISNFSFTPSNINTTDNPEAVTVTLRVTDIDRDVNVVGVSFRSLTGNQYVRVDLIGSRISGDARDGVYSTPLIFPQYSKAGTWRIEGIFVTDGVDSRNFNTSALAARGFATDLQVVSNNEDVIPPEILDFSFTPSVIDTTSGSRNIAITLRSKDQLSGVSGIGVAFTGPAGCDASEGECMTFDIHITGADRISGDDKDGVYRAILTLPQYSPNGLYGASVGARDAVSNFTFLGQARLAALGYPSQLEITLAAQE